MARQTNLQDLILNETRKSHLPVTMFLVNGFQLRGCITGFDSFVVIIGSEGRQQMVYKHAISTVVPSMSIDLAGE